jgi:hypothetical protein
MKTLTLAVRKRTRFRICRREFTFEALEDLQKLLSRSRYVHVLHPQESLHLSPCGGYKDPEARNVGERSLSTEVSDAFLTSTEPK